jgi:hypothetical protein
MANVRETMLRADDASMHTETMSTFVLKAHSKHLQQDQVLPRCAVANSARNGIPYIPYHTFTLAFVLDSHGAPCCLGLAIHRETRVIAKI